MIEAVQPSAIPIPPEVHDFAVQQGVSAELPAVIEMTRQLFPNATLHVFVEDDPEIANDRHIVIEAKHVKMSVREAVEAHWKWDDGLLACCPVPLVCVFRLGLELADD